MPGLRHVVGAIAALLAFAGAVTPAAAEPVRIGLSGDSIVEDGGVTSTTTLAAALRSQLRVRGYDARGWGYVPAHGSAPQLQPDGTVADAPWRYGGAWTFLGLTPFFDPASPIPHVLTSPFGADGHAVESASPLAAATAAVAGERFAAFFARAPDAGTFRFAVDDRARIVQAWAPGPYGGGVAWLSAPPNGRPRHTVALAPVTGTLRFTGLLSDPAPRPSRPGVAVLSLGRSCACASDAFPQPQRQALSALRLGLTVLMFGTNGQGKLIEKDTEARRARILAGLRARGEVARHGGGRCLIVPPPPNPRPPAVRAEIESLEQAAAAQAGCRYAPVFANLWSATDSVAAGATVDGIHPTPAGYRLMAAALADAIAERAPLPPRE